MEHSVLNHEMAALSKLLQATMVSSEAFEKAVENGYIMKTEDGTHLQWMLGSKTLLAYFCGRMWCGDRAVFSKRKKKMLWKAGKMQFPEKELQELFGVKIIRELRKQRKNFECPNNFQVIDNLFVTLYKNI